MKTGLYVLLITAGALLLEMITLWRADMLTISEVVFRWGEHWNPFVKYILGVLVGQAGGDERRRHEHHEPGDEGDHRQQDAEDDRHPKSPLESSS